MEREATAVLEQADHRRRRRVVLRRAHALGRRGGEDLAAQVAPPALARVDGGAQRGHPRDPHQRRGLRQRIDLARGAPGAAVAAAQRGVRDRHRVRAGVGGGARAAVAWARGPAADGPASARGLAPDPGAPGATRPDDRARLLRLRAEEEAAQAVERRLRRLQLRRDERERVHRGLQLRVVVRLNAALVRSTIAPSSSNAARWVGAPAVARPSCRRGRLRASSSSSERESPSRGDSRAPL